MQMCNNARCSIRLCCFGRTRLYPKHIAKRNSPNKRLYIKKLLLRWRCGLQAKRRGYACQFLVADGKSLNEYSCPSGQFIESRLLAVSLCGNCGQSSINTSMTHDSPRNIHCLALATATLQRQHQTAMLEQEMKTTMLAGSCPS